MPDSASAALPVTDPVALPGHAAISRTTIHGGWSIGLGLLVTVGGFWLSAVSLNWIATPDSRFGVPRDVTALMGGSFALCGLSFVVNGIAGLWRRVRASSVAADSWGLDHPWDSQGIRSRSTFRRNVTGVVLIGLFLLPFNKLLLAPTPDDPVSRSARWFIGLIILFFDLLVIVGAVYTAHLAEKDSKYGRSFLQFRRFPFFLGETLEADLQIEKPGRVPFSVTATLRFIEERFEIRQSGTSRVSEVVSYQLYAVTALLTGLVLRRHGAASLKVSFELPQGDQYRTNLRERPAKYWELAVESESSEVDYQASFLVPVYSRE